jgi:hypothetical protein
VRATAARKRRGNTLLEVIAASLVLSIALVPALRIMRDALAVEDDLEYANVLATLCASRLEQSLASTAASWNTTTDTGNFASVGYSRIRYSVTKSDLPANGGITGSLIALTCTVWDDADGNGVLGTSEKKVQFSTKLAKLAAYNASGS